MKTLTILLALALITGCSSIQESQGSMYQCFNGKLYEMRDPMYGIQVNYHDENGSIPCAEQLAIYANRSK